MNLLKRENIKINNIKQFCGAQWGIQEFQNRWDWTGAVEFFRSGDCFESPSNSCDSRKLNTYCKHCMLTMCHAVKIFKNKPIQNFKWEEMGGGVGGGTWCARPGSTSVALGGWMFDVLTCLMINIWIHLLYTFIKLISLMSIPDLYAKK